MSFNRIPMDLRVAWRLRRLRRDMVVVNEFDNGSVDESDNDKESNVEERVESEEFKRGTRCS